MEPPTKIRLIIIRYGAVFSLLMIGLVIGNIFNNVFYPDNENSGSAEATVINNSKLESAELYNKFGKTQMTSHDFSDEELEAIITFIELESLRGSIPSVAVL